jgi:hypothetical protein
VKKMKMMEKSWNEVNLERTLIETKVTFCANLFGGAAARSILTSRANRHGKQGRINNMGETGRSGNSPLDSSIEMSSLKGGRSL